MSTFPGKRKARKIPTFDDGAEDAAGDTSMTSGKYFRSGIPHPFTDADKAADVLQ